MQVFVSLMLSLSLLGSPTQGQTTPQEPIRFEQEIKKKVSGHFLLYLPKEYTKKREKYPLILFLHGAGERGSNLEMVKTHGPPRLVAEGKEFPFIIASPQCPEGQGWSIDTLNGMLDYLIKKYRIDVDRVYLTGLSMGGFGSWAWAASNPERFAAIAPICGGGDPKTVEKFKHIPVWVFHGDKDTTVPPIRSQQMVDALKAAGAEPKYTLYPEAGHDSWTETYNNAELYAWFLQFTRKKPTSE
jgi:predicted peptidase